MIRSQNSNRSSPVSAVRVNVAVVGLGFMGVTHIKAYQQLKAARIVAVCDSVRLPVNGVLAGVTGNITGSGDLVLGRAVKVYRALAEVLADAEGELVDFCVATAHKSTKSTRASTVLWLARAVKVYRALAEVLADAEVDLVDLCVPTPHKSTKSTSASAST